MSEQAKTAGRCSLSPYRITASLGRIHRAARWRSVPGIRGCEDSKHVAALMAEADARGGDAHGVFRLPQYVKQIQSGAVNPRPTIKIVRDHPGSALIDGDNALGHLVMKRATELAIEKARHCGVAWVGTRHSNHAGPAQLYPRMAAAQNMIGLYFCVGNANLLPPWGGTEVLLSTNPISVSVPGLRHPTITLDMATTNTAFGKIRLKAQRGEPMPEGWMIDREGKPLTDAKRASEGFLLPIGGPKGYGLALMIGLLAGTLNGAAFGRDVVDYTVDSKTPSNTGQIDHRRQYRGLCGPRIVQRKSWTKYGT